MKNTPEPTPREILQKAARFPLTGNRLAGKTVVQILPAMNRGGVERGTYDMARAIIGEQGRAVIISNGGAMLGDLARIGAEHIRLPVHSKNPLAWPFIRSRVGRALDETCADIVHIRSRAPAWIAMGAARKRNIPVVTTIHSRFTATKGPKKIYNGIMVRGDRVIAISDYVGNLVRRIYPDAASRLMVIHRGVDLTRFSPEAVKPARMAAALAHLNLPDDRRIIMLPARPTAWKGFDALIDAAAQITEHDFYLALVGAGDGSDKFRDRLLARIEAAGLAGKAKLCSATDDMPAAMLLAHVVVMPSVTPEPFGRIAIEAQAMGVPVIAFAHGGAVETIADGQTGDLVAPGDTAGLAGALRAVLTRPAAARTRMGEAAQRRVRRKFSAVKMYDETIALYCRLMRSRRN